MRIAQNIVSNQFLKLLNTNQENNNIESDIKLYKAKNAINIESDIKATYFLFIYRNTFCLKAFWQFYLHTNSDY